MRKIYIILTTISLSLPALADYHYASHTGSNTFPYISWETATDSIKYAITAADAGDTVYIAAGEYDQSYYMTPADSCLAIIGAGIDSTHWYYTGTNPPLEISNNTLVTDIYFSSHYQSLSTYFDNNAIINHCRFSNGLGIIVFSGCRLTVENCVFDTVTGAVMVWGGSYSLTIRNNLVNYDRESSFYGLDADTVLVENNIIIDPQWESIDMDTADNVQMIRNNLVFQHFPDYRVGDCWDCRVVINNTFDNIKNIYTPVAAINVNYFGTQVIKNNSFSRIPYAAIDVTWGSRHVHVYYTNLWQVGSLAVGMNVDLDTIGIQWRDPMFVDVNDYHLQAFSPLIDAGDPAILDINGTRSDIGVYGGPQGSSYQYQDLPPQVPDSLSAQILADTTLILWRMNKEADFALYHIYRDTISGFMPSEFNHIADAESSFYADGNLPPSRRCYYRISALDNHGNVSGYSNELEVALVGIGEGFGAEAPSITTIESNYPNPFNSQTIIVYRVANLGPIPARINIDIYDILGRLIRNLIDAREEIGAHQVIWDGNDGLGREMPSGVYFAKISQWGVAIGNKPKKLVLIR